jgi:hypothetical protein
MLGGVVDCCSRRNGTGNMKVAVPQLNRHGPDMMQGAADRTHGCQLSAPGRAAAGVFIH